MGRLPDPGTMQRNLAADLGIPVDNVSTTASRAAAPSVATCSTTRRSTAAQVSKRIGKPVKLQWMREEGIKHGRCRPVSLHKVKAVISNGDVVGWEHRMACPEMDVRHGFGDVVSGYVTEYNNEGADQDIFVLTQKLAYKTGPTSITLKQQLLAKPTAACRVVYSGQVGAANEIIIDEVARHLGKDELDFRMRMLEVRTAYGRAGEVRRGGAVGPQPPGRSGAGHRHARRVQVDRRLHHGSRHAPQGTSDDQVHDRRRQRLLRQPGRDQVEPAGGRPTTASASSSGQASTSTTGQPGSRTSTSTSWARMFDSAPEMSVHILPASNVPARRYRRTRRPGRFRRRRRTPGLGPRASKPGTSRSTSTEPDCDAGDHLQPQWQPGLGRRRQRRGTPVGPA